MIPAKIENVFLEVITNKQGIIKNIVAGKFAIKEFVINTSIFTPCPFLFGSLDAIPKEESFLMEGMIIVSENTEFNVDLELFSSHDDISVLIHNRSKVYKTISQLNQNRNDLFFMKREISEKNKELAILREASDKANEEKTRFLAMMSHEIRNPLNTILGYANMISEENLSDKVQEYVSYLSRASTDLKVIVEDILDLSRIEAGKLELALEEINLNSLVKNCFVNFKNQNKNNSLKLELFLSEELPKKLLGDSVRVTQILNNLMSNALKFTKKGTVSLHAEIISESSKTSEIRLKIVDTGRGMSEEQTVKIFDEYSQTKLDDNRVFGGAGLGLSIVKRMVEAMNGSISVASKLNLGTTFSVEIPFKKVLNVKGSTEISLQKSLKGKRILLADDDVLNHKITSYFLEKEEMIITSAENGLEALQAINEHHFDVVILDINMPEFSGEELMSQKATFLKNKKIPFIALTGNATQEYKRNYLKIGFSDVIFKPFKPEEFIRKIKALNL